MSVIMYKVVDGKIEEECVRPVGYQEHLKNGWVVDLAELESPKEEKDLSEKEVVVKEVPEKPLKSVIKKPIKKKKKIKISGK